MHVRARARPDDHVGAVVDAREEVGDLRLRVRAVAVGDHDDVVSRAHEARLQRCSVALVARMAHDGQHGKARREFREHTCRPVLRTVVDDEDLDRDTESESGEPLDDARDPPLLVVGGHDEGHAARRRSRGRVGLEGSCARGQNGIPAIHSAIVQRTKLARSTLAVSPVGPRPASSSGVTKRKGSAVGPPIQRPANTRARILWRVIECATAPNSS